MKKIILIIAIVFTYNLSIGQNFTELDNYEFTTVESYETEKNNVLACANYLFSNPANEADPNRMISIVYIINWMEGTPDYTFEIGEQATELTEGNVDLFALYLVGMSKVVIENKGEKLDDEAKYRRTEEILVNYCSISNNNMKPSKKIKKILKSRKN